MTSAININKRSLLILLVATTFLFACGRVNQKLDEDYKRGHNGILWGEKAQAAANWIQTQKQTPVQLRKQSDPKAAQESAKLRKEFLKRLNLRSVPDVKGNKVAAYNFLGLRYVMNFDKEDRFCSVTFGPVQPAPPLTPDKKIDGTLKKFKERIIAPLAAQYGKPKRKSFKKGDIIQKYWIWEGEKVSCVVEFIFSKQTSQTPAFWQYSESILLASPKYYRTNA